VNHALLARSVSTPNPWEVAKWWVKRSRTTAVAALSDSVRAWSIGGLPGVVSLLHDARQADKRSHIGVVERMMIRRVVSSTGAWTLVTLKLTGKRVK
jgi:hypothetical protein